MKRIFAILLVAVFFVAFGAGYLLVPQAKAACSVCQIPGTTYCSFTECCPDGPGICVNGDCRCAN